MYTYELHLQTHIKQIYIGSRHYICYLHNFTDTHAFSYGVQIFDNLNGYFDKTSKRLQIKHFNIMIAQHVWIALDVKHFFHVVNF